MTRLPLDVLLSVASLGMAGGSGWFFYEATLGAEPGRDAVELGKIFEKHEDLGRARQPDDRHDDHGVAVASWWALLRDVNITGELRDGPPPPPPPPPPGPPLATELPLSAILRVECIVAGEQADTRVVISYLPEANVTPPDRAAEPPAEPRQHLALDDALWPPHDHIRLVRIADDAASVIFLREDPNTRDPKDAREEEVFKVEAFCSADVARKLVESLREKKRAGTGQPEADVSRWQDVERTSEVRPGEWVISREDDTYLRENIERVLEDLGLETFRGSKYRGLQLTRVPERLRRLGLAAGDVIVEINGVPVDTRAEAITVGKKQYGRGVRTFRVELLSHGRLEQRTIHAPDE